MAPRQGIDAGFGFGSQQDPHNPERVLADIAPDGLGLPDRDDYLEADARLRRGARAEGRFMSAA